MDHAKFKRLALVSGIDIRHTEEHAGEEFEDQLATFAELIVLKCVGIIEEQSKDAIRNKTYMGDDVPASVTQMAIKEHFGVE